MATNAQTQALRTMMSSLLMSDAAQQIDFYLDRLHVDGSGFSFVALALLPKPQGQHGFSIRVGHVNPNAEATYQPANNTFDFPTANYGTTPFQRSSIIHECVHALRDCFGGQLRTSTGLIRTLSLSDEAAAYVAGALFHINDTTPAGAPTPSAPPWTQGDVVFGNAHTIAVKHWKTRGYAVDPSDAKNLRDAIMNDPVYKFLKSNPKQTYTNNGVSL
jgi:hypothetical protein